MDVKDQRLEIRIPQQQLDDLDEIRNSVDTSYIPSRSDVARMYISQGIARHQRGGQESPDELPLGQRLSLFFQLEQLELMVHVPSSSHSKPYHDGRITEITQIDVVKSIYLNRFFWFFELDAEGLKTVSTSFQNHTILSLLNKESNTDTIRNLKYASELVRMFNSIKNCLDQTYDRDEAVDIINKFSKRNSIPLRFSGFAKDSLQLNEMAALVDWLDSRTGKYGPHIISSENDYSTAYNKLLSVYRDHIKHYSELNIDSLQEIILDRRLG
jgi:hypothetical protein